MDLRQLAGKIATETLGATRPVGAPALLIHYTGSLEAAILLNQIAYWSDRATLEGGWIAKSYDEWKAEIFLTKYQVKIAAQLLEGMGILETKTSKWGNTPTLHYRILSDNYRAGLYQFAESEKLESGKLKIELSIVKNWKVDSQKLESQGVNSSLSESQNFNFPYTNNTRTKNTSKNTNKQEKPAVSVSASAEPVFLSLAFKASVEIWFQYIEKKSGDRPCWTEAKGRGIKKEPAALKELLIELERRQQKKTGALDFIPPTSYKIGDHAIDLSIEAPWYQEFLRDMPARKLAFAFAALLNSIQAMGDFYRNCAELSILNQKLVTIITILTDGKATTTTTHRIGANTANEAERLAELSRKRAGLD